MSSRCTDARFEQQLYAYELGMLNEAEREALELHLLECEHCFARVAKFALTASLLRDSQTVRDLAARQAITPADGERATRKAEVKPTRSVVMKISLAAAAVLVFLILKPWQFEFRPTHEAVAAEDRLAILQFNNLTRPDDPERLGDIVSRLLIADLSNSSYMQVVSSQRIEDISRVVGDTSALEIARRASARWLLTGDVYESSDSVRLSFTLVDVGTGVVLSSQEIAGETGETTFALVDRLSEVVRGELSLPAQAAAEADLPVAEVTTSSAEAYRNYVEGLEYEGKYYLPEAVAAFERAVAADSTFAMAYYHLALLKSTTYIARAVEFGSKASWLEQRYINALAAQVARKPELLLAALHEILARYPDEKDACFRLGDYYWRLIDLDSAVTYYRRAATIDPTFRNAWNSLAYAYSEQEDLDRAIEAINRYIDLAPDEANPYDSRGDMYAFNGKMELAAESYQRALAIKPDYWASAINLAAMRTFQGRYQEADSIYARLECADRIGIRAQARLYRPTVLMRQGRLIEALAAIERGRLETKADLEAAGEEGERLSFYELKARVYAEMERYDEALAVLDTAITIYRRDNPQDSVAYGYLRATYLANTGDFEAAETARRQLANHAASAGGGPSYSYWSAAGIELARNNPKGAIEPLEKEARIMSVTASFTTYDLLARAYLEAGDLGKAVPLLERLTRINATERLTSMTEVVKLHYYLGIAYEESRWYDRAAEQYRMFLDIWKNADPGLKPVDDARQRLAKLQS